jgi:hypothetical protein
MTTENPSRATLADLISLISNAEIADRQKQDLRSAVNTVAKVLGADPAAVAADPILLRRRLEQISPKALGPLSGALGQRSVAVGKALALARPMLPGRSLEPLMPEWEPSPQRSPSIGGFVCCRC